MSQEKLLLKGYGTGSSSKTRHCIVMDINIFNHITFTVLYMKPTTEWCYKCKGNHKYCIRRK